MGKYAIYHKTTGKVSRIEFNNEQDMLLGLSSDEDYIKGDYSVNDIIDVSTKKLKQYKITTVQDICESVKLSDTELNNVIAHTEDVLFNGITVSQYRINNYIGLRSLSYPKYGEYLDAQTKLSSADATLRAEGQVQLDKYYADCLAVKERFPKE